MSESQYWEHPVQKKRRIGNSISARRRVELFASLAMALTVEKAEIVGATATWLWDAAGFSDSGIG